MAPPGGEHGNLSIKLNEVLTGQFSKLPQDVRSNYRLLPQEAGFLLETEPDTVLAPDMAILEASQMAAHQGPGFYHFAPVIAIEILSPSNTRKELIRKMAKFFYAGTAEFWIFDPSSQTLTIENAESSLSRLLSKEDVFEAGGVLRGISFPLARLFD